MIRQVGERNDQFQRLVVWRLRVLKVIRAKQPGETKVFYFLDDLFPSRPGEAILPLDHDGECDHVPELLPVAFLKSLSWHLKVSTYQRRASHAMVFLADRDVNICRTGDSPEVGQRSFAALRMTCILARSFAALRMTCIIVWVTNIVNTLASRHRVTFKEGTNVNKQPTDS